MTRRATIQEEYLTTALFSAHVAQQKGRWCEKCKVHHRPGTKCPYELRQQRQRTAPTPSEPSKEPKAHPLSGHGGLPPAGTVAKETVVKLQSDIQAGKLAPGMTADQHIELGKEVIAAHKASFPEFKAKLANAAPPTARVLGRVKELDSLIGKLTRKPDLYKKATDLGDTTGTRIVCDSIDEVKSTVAKLKQQFEVVEEEDFIDQPNRNYRSFHLNVRDADGQVKEIQVRTENQNTWAEWGHNIYKPMNAAQERALKTHKDEINEYAEAISSYFYQQDLGQPATKPPCTIVVHESFGCL